MSDIIKQLKHHLKTEAPDGLPSDWFVKADKLKSREATLESLRNQATNCSKCALCESRIKVVFGTGFEKRPVIAFVGDTPGKEENLTGEPFVGRAGELLNAAIEKGLKLSKKEVYICNVIKCAPPENRAPRPEEVTACSTYLHAQLELVRPDVIIALGSVAQEALSGVEQDIEKLRGNWQEWRGIKLMPTFHPDYILRNPETKKPFWHDLKLVMEYLGLE